MTDHPEAKAPDVTDHWDDPKVQADHAEMEAFNAEDRAADDKDLERMTEEQIREYLTARDIGIRQTTIPNETINWDPSYSDVKFP